MAGDITEGLGVERGRCPTTEALSFMLYRTAANFYISVLWCSIFIQKIIGRNRSQLLP